MAKVSKALWLQGIYSDAAKMKANARDERNDGIRALHAKYAQEIKDIDAMTKSQIAQGPPMY